MDMSVSCGRTCSNRVDKIGRGFGLGFHFLEHKPAGLVELGQP